MDFETLPIFMWEDGASRTRHVGWFDRHLHLSTSKTRGSHVQEECVSKIDCPDDSCGLQKTCQWPGVADVDVDLICYAWC